MKLLHSVSLDETGFIIRNCTENADSFIVVSSSFIVEKSKGLPGLYEAIGVLLGVIVLGIIVAIAAFVICTAKVLNLKSLKIEAMHRQASNTSSTSMQIKSRNMLMKKLHLYGSLMMIMSEALPIPHQKLLITNQEKIKHLLSLVNWTLVLVHILIQLMAYK